MSLLFSVVRFLCPFHIFLCLSWLPPASDLKLGLCVSTCSAYCLGDLEQHNLESPGASLRARDAYQDSVGFVQKHPSSLPPAPELASFLGILSPAFFCCSCLAARPPSKSLLSICDCRTAELISPFLGDPVNSARGRAFGVEIWAEGLFVDSCLEILLVL